MRLLAGVCPPFSRLAGAGRRKPFGLDHPIAYLRPPAGVERASAWPAFAFSAAAIRNFKSDDKSDAMGFARRDPGPRKYDTRASRTSAKRSHAPQMTTRGDRLPIKFVSFLSEANPPVFGKALFFCHTERRLPKSRHPGSLLCRSIRRSQCPASLESSVLNLRRKSQA
jgi:hypothetical protein